MAVSIVVCSVQNCSRPRSNDLNRPILAHALHNRFWCTSNDGNCGQCASLCTATYGGSRTTWLKSKIDISLGPEEYSSTSYEISFRRKFEQRTIVPFCGPRVWLNLDFRPYSVQLGLKLGNLVFGPLYSNLLENHQFLSKQTLVAH